MKKAANNLLGVLVVALALGLIGLLIYGLIRGVDENPALVGSVLTAGLTVAGGIWLAAYQARLQHREDTARIQREKITENYEGLIEYVSNLADKDEPPSEDDLKFLRGLSHKMLLWSGPDMIATWANGQRIVEKDPPEPAAVIAYGRNLKAIRRELGHRRDDELDLRDLLRLIVNDVDEHIEAGLK